MSFRIALFCCFALACNAAGLPNIFSHKTKLGMSGTRSENKVVGGEVAADGQFPYQVSLQQFWSHFCGGSLIAPDTVITAAHCIQGQWSTLVGVHAGGNSVGGLPVSSGISEWDYHENYRGDGPNDIAYIKLSRPFTLGDNIGLVKLPGPGITPSLEPGACTVSGWGATNAAGSVYPDALHFADIEGLSDEECQAQFDAMTNPPQGINFNADSNFCAHTPGGIPNACFGDSGGPLVCTSNEDGERYLFGVVSWGSNPCGEDGFPAVYTDVVTFLPWIEEKTGVTGKSLL